MQKIVFISLLKYFINVTVSAGGNPPTVPPVAPLPDNCINPLQVTRCLIPPNSDVKYVQDHLFNHQELVFDQSPFKEDKWNNHTCELFNNLTDLSSRILISWLAKPQAKQEGNAKYLEDWDVNHLKKMVANITKNDIKVLRNKEVCKNFASLLKYFPSTLLDDIRADCLSYMLSELKLKTSSLSETPISILDQMSDFFLERYSRQIIFRVQDIEPGALASLKAATLFKLFKNEKNCSLINADTYKLLIKDKERAKIFGPICFAAFASVPANQAALMDPVGSSVTNLPTEVFEINTHSLHSDYFAHMTAEQALHYNKLIETGYRKCQTMELDKMKSHNIKGVDPTCAISHIYLRSGPMNELGTLWNNLNTELFSIPQPGTLESIFSKINTNDWPKIKGDLLNRVFTQIEGCEHLPVEAIANKKMVIGGRCFQKLNHRAQAKALLIMESLPDDLLDYVDGDMVMDWSVDIKGKHYRGLESLMAIQGKSGAAKVIERLGSQAEGRHPCTTLDDFESLKRNVILQKHMSLDCFKEHLIDIRENQWKFLDPRLIGLQSYDKIIAGIKDWSKVSKPQMEVIVKGGTFCKGVTLEVFKLLNVESLSVIDAKCMADLPIKGGLEVDQLKHIPEGSFTLITANGARSFSSLDKLTHKQFGMLGAEVIDSANSGASIISADHLSTASKERIAAIKVWGKIPSASYKGLVDKVKFTAIPPESMGEMTLNQVKEIPILHEITVPQIEQIGKNIQGPENPIHVFTDDILAKMTSEQKEAIEKRKKILAGSPSSAHDNQISSIAAIVIGIVLIIVTTLW